MFIYSINGKKLKMIALCTVLIIGVVLCYTFINKSDPYTLESGNIPVNIKISSDSDVKSFLEQYGWQVSDNPTEISTIRIPSVFNDVYASYNTLQLSQGFDLSKFMGETCKKYTYSVLNYPDKSENINATVIVYGDKVIAGDIADSSFKGFMQGLNRTS